MKTLAVVSLVLFTGCIDQTDADPEVSEARQDVANCTGNTTLGGTDHYLALGAPGTSVDVATDDRWISLRRDHDRGGGERQRPQPRER
jgi:hypothetical protein